MRIARPEHGATAEAVEFLITSKCLVSRFVNENEQIVGSGFQFFVKGRHPSKQNISSHLFIGKKKSLCQNGCIPLIMSAVILAD
jgi:hypothetical protein